jgi:hypothetical protein
MRRIDEGQSSATVLEAEWVTPSPAHNQRLILKLDSGRRLAKEVLAWRLLPKKASSFMAIDAFSFTNLDEPPATRECLIYTHAEGQYPGRVTSLLEMARAAVTDGNPDIDAVAERVGVAVGLLELQARSESQYHQGHGQQQLDFYLKRWAPTITVSCDRAELGSDGALRLLSDDPHTASLDLGSGFQVREELIGSTVRCEADKLYLDPDLSPIYANVPNSAVIEIQGVTPHHCLSVLGELSPNEVSRIDIVGRLIATDQHFYAERAAACSLKPDTERWTIAGHDFSNPFVGRQARVRRWSHRSPMPTYSFGHGDLHGGNVLCINGATVIIDHALAGKPHPAWADPARLIMSLWRNAIADCLTADQIGQAVIAAFIDGDAPSETVDRAARLLKGSVNAALENGPRSADRERELWIDLHHQASIGLKWRGSPEQWLASLLDRALTGEWGPADSNDAANVRANRDGLYDAYDRVVLVDILFFAYAHQWDEQVLGLLLDLAGDGEPDVELEAAMVIAWLLRMERAWAEIEAKPEAQQRLIRLLDRREFAEAVSIANRILISKFIPAEDRLPDYLSKIPSTLHLRPLDHSVEFPLAACDGRQARLETQVLGAFNCCFEFAFRGPLFPRSALIRIRHQASPPCIRASPTQSAMWPDVPLTPPHPAISSSSDPGSRDEMSLIVTPSSDREK